MSKAFTKESDGDDDDRDLADEPAIPGGFTNYITPAGHKRLNDELERLWKVDRPKLVDTIGHTMVHKSTRKTRTLTPQLIARAFAPADLAGELAGYMPYVQATIFLGTPRSPCDAPMRWMICRSNCRDVSQLVPSFWPPLFFVSAG